jgi:predicted DNA-binding transcriptional regulator AlpA
MYNFIDESYSKIADSFEVYDEQTMLQEDIKHKLTAKQQGRAYYSPLWNIEEVSGYLRKSKSSVYQLIDQRDNKYDATFPQKIKLGRRTYFKQADIIKWLNLQMEK